MKQPNNGPSPMRSKTKYNLATNLSKLRLYSHHRCLNIMLKNIENNEQKNRNQLTNQLSNQLGNYLGNQLSNYLTNQSRFKQNYFKKYI